MKFDPKVQLESQLQRLIELPANWDGEGAPRISEESIEVARHLLSDLPGWMTATVYQLTAQPGGCVQAEWEFGRGISIEVELMSKVAAKILWHSDIESTEMKICSGDVVPAVRRWLRDGPKPVGPAIE